MIELGLGLDQAEHIGTVKCSIQIDKKNNIHCIQAWAELSTGYKQRKS